MIRVARRPFGGRGVAAALAILVAALTTVLSPPASASVQPFAAAPEGDASAAPIGLAVEPSMPSYPEGAVPVLRARVSNLSGQSCSMAATSALTLTVVDASRDGQPLLPSYARALAIDGAAGLLAARMSEVASPGELAFDIDTGDGLAASIVLPDGGLMQASYPLGEPGSYRFALAYAMPPAAFADAPGQVCAGMSPIVTVAFTVGASPPGGLPWPLIAAAAAVLVALAVIIVVLARRGRRRVVAGAAAVLMLATAGVVAVEGAWPTPAAAGIIYGPGNIPGPNDPTYPIYQTYSDCMSRIIAFDPGLAADLNNVKATVYPLIPPFSTMQTRFLPGGDSLVAWDPFTGTGFKNETSGAAYDPCAGLYHELVHARDHAKGALSSVECDDTGVLLDEVIAVIEENKFRAAQRPPLKPRTTYDGKKIPLNIRDCAKKKTDKGNKPPTCRGIDGPCGDSNGDPHLTTFDGYRFDLQAVGEFVAVRSSADDLQIQVRQSAFRDSRTVSVNTAVAMMVAGDRLGFYVDQGRVTVRQDGAPVTVPLGTSSLPGGGTIDYAVDPVRGDSFAVVWPDGSAAWVSQVGVWGLVLAVQPRAGRIGTLTGLLGPFDGDRTNDVSTADGIPLSQPPSFDDLYGAYAQGWRVTDATSLFDYAPGTGTADFTDLSFPDRPATVDSLPPAQAEAARQACTLLGITDPALMANCVLDVASTGQAIFAVDAARAQAVHGGGTGSGSIGPAQTLTVDGVSEASVAFEGAAGQRAYVDVTETTLPDGCGAPTLVSPSGVTLAIGCLSGGRGSIDATALPETGAYRVAVPARDGVSGTMTLRVVLSEDVVGTIVPDGPDVTLTVGVPGQVAWLDFTATAGQKVFVDVVASTVGPGCGPIGLAPARSRIAIGLACIDPSGAGLLDTATITSSGTHSVYLDPPEGATGSATVRLTVIQDQRQSIVLGGPAVLATVSEPGAQSLLTFTGTAGQSVTVEATGGTPGLVGCGSVVLRDPAGIDLTVGCLDGAGTGTLGPTILPVSGTYTIAVDPGDRRTGSVTVRAHT